MEYEIKANVDTLPVITDNLTSLKAGLVEVCEKYHAVDVTDATYRSAKADLAMLRKAKSAFDSKRISIHSDLERPYDEFLARFNDTMTPLDEAITAVSEKLKKYEDAVAKEKEERIREFMDEAFGKTEDEELFPYADYEWFFDKKWLNRSCADSKWQAEVGLKIAQIKNDLPLIKANPFAPQCLARYKETGSLMEALSYGAKLKAEAEQNQLAEKTAPSKPVQIQPTLPVAEEAEKQDAGTHTIIITPPASDKETAEVVYLAEITGKAYLILQLKKAMENLGVKFECKSVHFKEEN